jgi:chemotaxis protein CheD
MIMEYNIHFLYPSNLYVSKEPAWVTTILGSCVAVCLFDPVYKIGGINHYMLPFWNGKGLASPKYGNIAIEKLVERMRELGSNRPHLQAKIFGGGEVLNSNFNHYNIGERNIETAFQLMKDLKINVVSSSTGGQKGRRIQFDTFSGIVRQRYIDRQQLQDTVKNVRHE